MAVLVLADHDNAALNPATLNAITAAAEIDGEVHVLVAGENCAAVAEAAARVSGVAKAIHIDDAAYAHHLAENMAPLLVDLAAQYSHVLAAHNAQGKNILPRAAALLDIAQISDIMEVVSADTFVRPIYAGNALATVQSSDTIKFITVRGTAFAAADDSGGAGVVEVAAAQSDQGLSRFDHQDLSSSERPELTSARIVISGGRGMQGGENFHLLEEIADLLGAAVGASRAAVDAGYVTNEYQVGQTGKIVAPDLYIAVGISGAIQHLAGMKDSKVIVAINKDAEAPIFQVADYGVVGDLFVILPALKAALES
jgi:electron transfer flavoprotein alpha subunit